MATVDLAVRVAMALETACAAARLAVTVAQLALAAAAAQVALADMEVLAATVDVSGLSVQAAATAARVGLAAAAERVGPAQVRHCFLRPVKVATVATVATGQDSRYSLAASVALVVPAHQQDRLRLPEEQDRLVHPAHRGLTVHKNVRLENSSGGDKQGEGRYTVFLCATGEPSGGS